MHYTVKATHIELTEELKSYITKKWRTIERHVHASDTHATAAIEVARTTEHHHTGKVFRAEINLHVAGNSVYADAVAEDIHAALDRMKDEVIRILSTRKTKQVTQQRRGGYAAKQQLRRG